jgi:hypothetical protein
MDRPAIPRESASCFFEKVVFILKVGILSCLIDCSKERSGFDGVSPRRDKSSIVPTSLTDSSSLSQSSFRF